MSQSSSPPAVRLEADEIPSRFRVSVVDSLIYLARPGGSTSLKCVISLGGRVDEKRIKRAVRLSLDAEPVLGCRFVEHWYRPYWKRRSDLDQLAYCTVIETSAPAASLSRFLVDPIDPCRDPLVQVAVFRGPADTICIKIAHEAADMPSVKRYVRLLFGLYGKLKDAPGYRPEPNLGGVRDMRVFRGSFTLSQKARFLCEVAARIWKLGGRGSWLRPSPRETRPVKGYALMKLPAERVRLLLEYGRDRGATLTHVMLAGFYRAMRKMYTPTSKSCTSIATTIDLRRFLPAERQSTAISNISCGVPFLLDPCREYRFDDLLEIFKSGLGMTLLDPASVGARAVLASSILGPLLRAVPFALMRRRAKAAAEKFRNSERFTAALVNYGKLDAELDPAGDLPFAELFLAGPLFYYGALFAGLSGFRDAVTISLGFADSAIDQTCAKALLLELDRELPYSAEAPGAVSALTAADGGGGGPP